MGIAFFVFYIMSGSMMTTKKDTKEHNIATTWFYSSNLFIQFSMEMILKNKKSMEIKCGHNLLNKII